MFVSTSLHVLQPPLPPVFLVLGVWCACVQYTPAFQDIDICVVQLLSACKKLAMYDAASVMIRLGAKVVGTLIGNDVYWTT